MSDKIDVNPLDNGLIANCSRWNILFYRQDKTASEITELEDLTTLLAEYIPTAAEMNSLVLAVTNNSSSLLSQGTRVGDLETLTIAQGLAIENNESDINSNLGLINTNLGLINTNLGLINTKQDELTYISGTGSLPTSGWTALTGEEKDYYYDLPTTGMTTSHRPSFFMNDTNQALATEIELSNAIDSQSGSIRFKANAVPITAIALEWEGVKW